MANNTTIATTLTPAAQQAAANAARSTSAGGAGSQAQAPSVEPPDPLDFLGHPGDYDASNFGLSAEALRDVVHTNPNPAFDPNWNGTDQMSEGAALGPFLSGNVGEVINSFWQMSAPQRRDVQIQLALTGYDTRAATKIKFGEPDPGSYMAWAKLIENAYTSGKAVSQLLNAAGPASGEALGALSASQHAYVVHHAATTDVVADGLRGAQAAIGRDFTAEEKTRFLAVVRGKEDNARTDTSGQTSQTINDVGNITNEATAFAKQEDPELAQGYSRIQAFGTMLSALGFNQGSTNNLTQARG